MSNNERQERFRRSHPGYNKKYRTSMRAHRRMMAQQEAAAKALETATNPVAPTAAEPAAADSHVELTISAMAA